MRRAVHRVASDDGVVVCERCALADSFVTRLRGLLGRKALAQGDGLMISPAGSVHTMFMRFTIDAIFLDKTFEVVGVAPGLRPWRLAARRRARHVLELAEGEARRRGVSVGQKLSLAPGGAV
jgi:uncharacterized membrane protein (UPF0127 family)